MNKSCDYLIIGSGIAGLSSALKVADHASVIIVAKSDISVTNTQKAQGGIASVTYAPDNFEKHINDTIVCGSNQGAPHAIRLVVENAPEQINQLIKWGVNFDKIGDKYDLAREGGHSESRILHYKDSSGAEIQRALVDKVLAHPNITILENMFSVDLITQHHKGELINKGSKHTECYGVYILDIATKKIFTITSKITILATGGVGNVYQTTTNPIIATGDGVAMVHRAKGVIDNMEFIQFHPTSLYNPSERPSFLITEAMRGFGAILKTRKGEDFMFKYHKMGSLAPRDIVARSIDNELKATGDDYLYLDVTAEDADRIRAHFPQIYAKCISLGIDITKDMIPIVPAAHYSCGGVKVDSNSQTSINRLYATGEVASTGLHGANRLASNSLTEAIVYSELASQHSLKRLSSIENDLNIPDWNDDGTSHPEEMVLITQSYKEMQQIMSNYVGIVRSKIRLERAFRRMEGIFIETEELYKTSTLSQPLCELRNMIAVGYLIIKQAKELDHSVGLHYLLDCD